MLQRIDSALFTKYLHEGGSVTKIFGWKHRYTELYKHKDVLYLYAIGYCKGASLYYKAKVGWYAVMFSYNNITWWNHFTGKEFQDIFMEVLL